MKLRARGRTQLVVIAWETVLAPPAPRQPAEASPPGASGAPAHRPRGRQPMARRVRWVVTGLTAAAIAFVAVLQSQAESAGAAVIGPAPPAIERIIPPGACVLTDQVSMTILANRFYSDVPGCSQMVNSVGTDLALSHGRKPSDGAGYVPAVAAVWRDAFSHAQLVLLSHNNAGRVAWTPALKAYFDANFVQLKSLWKHVQLYKRKGFDLRRAWAASRSR